MKHGWVRVFGGWRCSNCGHVLVYAFAPSPGEKVLLSREDMLRTFDGEAYTQWASCDEVVALRVLAS